MDHLEEMLLEQQQWLERLCPDVKALVFNDKRTANKAIHVTEIKRNGSSKYFSRYGAKVSVSF